RVTVLKAEATRDSEIIRGDGDAERNSIFAKAFGQDPDFFAFYRSMQAYEAGLKANDTRLVLTPNTDFFKYFNDPAGSKSNSR
ncbi:MAG: protease modulator HflC, partial [Methyloligellaceae bacterium]